MAVQPGLCRTWSETPKTGFLTTRLICQTCYYKLYLLNVFESVHLLGQFIIKEDLFLKQKLIFTADYFGNKNGTSQRGDPHQAPQFDNEQGPGEPISYHGPTTLFSPLTSAAAEIAELTASSQFGAQKKDEVSSKIISGKYQFLLEKQIFFHN